MGIVRGQHEALVETGAQHVLGRRGDVQPQPGADLAGPQVVDGPAMPKSPPGVVHGVDQLVASGIQTVVTGLAWTLGITEVGPVGEAAALVDVQVEVSGIDGRVGRDAIQSGCGPQGASG